MNRISYLRSVMKWKFRISSLFCISIFSFFSLISFSQNNALVLNGAYVVLNGGSNVSPIYLVVNQSNTLGITRTTGHIVSEGQYNFVQWECGTGTGAYTYPFGVGGTPADYIPFIFNKTSGGNSSVDVSTWATNPQNVPHPGVSNVAAVCCMKGNGDSVTSAIDRFWDIRATATADLTFRYRGTENTTSVPGDPFKAQHWNGTKWDIPVGTGQAGVTGATIGTVGPVTGQTTFSPWVLSRGTAILPVELIRFSTQCSNNNVIVNWTTGSEQNNDFFTVERSPDALNYQPIGIVNGAGNSSLQHNYSFTDSDPLAGTSYYRLRQTDFNGLTEIFSSASLSSCASGGGLSVLIGQNPGADGNISIVINGAVNKNVRISVIDMLGQSVYRKDLTGLTGSFLLNEHVSLAGGIYLVSASTAEENFSRKIVVVR